MPRSKSDNAQRPEKKMFCIDDDTETKLQELCKEMQISRSNAVRICISKLHDFVVNDTYPDGLKRASEKERDALMSKQGAEDGSSA